MQSGYYVQLVLTGYTLMMGALAARWSKREEMVAHQKIASEKHNDIEFWPKWQVKALCGYQVLILLLWLYSWRHLIGL